MTTMTIGEMAELVAGEVVGDAAVAIRDVAAIHRAGSDCITFADSNRNLKKLVDCDAGCVLLSREAGAARRADWRPTNYILVDDPAAAVLALLARLRPQPVRAEVGRSPQANVSDSATIGKNTNIHPGATIGEHVVIGNECDIHPGVVIGNGCVLGDGVVLYPNVVLYDGVQIGNRVRVHASAVIGTDGFGYRTRDGRREKIPHFGTVRIEDDVEIGAGTTIDRAMIGETVVGEGTKIDNLVMVAHNCEIGRHNIIVGQVGFAGSVTTGDHVVVAGHVGVADHVHLGERCVIGSKAGVHKDVPAGETYIGLPAAPAAEAMRVGMAQKKLPDALKTIRLLESRVEELTRLIEEMNARTKPTENIAA